MTKHIVLASKNPVKEQAALKGFQKIFPEEAFEIQTISVPSGVSDQPMTDSETLRGAMTRSKNAREMLPEADFWIGIEGGVEELDGDLAAYAWIVVHSRNCVGKGRTGVFFLPTKIAELVRQGIELGDADDVVFQRVNSKQENGAVGILTHNVIDRVGLYSQAVVLALIPFRNPDLYLNSTGRQLGK